MHRGKCKIVGHVKGKYYGHSWDNHLERCKRCARHKCSPMGGEVSWCDIRARLEHVIQGISWVEWN